MTKCDQKNVKLCRVSQKKVQKCTISMLNSNISFNFKKNHAVLMFFSKIIKKMWNFNSFLNLFLKMCNIYAFLKSFLKMCNWQTALRKNGFQSTFNSNSIEKIFSHKNAINAAKFQSVTVLDSLTVFKHKKCAFSIILERTSNNTVFKCLPWQITTTF